MSTSRSRRRRRDNPTISVSPPSQQAPPSPSRRRRRNNPTISVSPPQQPPPSPSRPRRSLRLTEKMVHLSISCHDDLQALQDRSDGHMFLKLVSLESLLISTDSYALLRNLIEQGYCQCPQIDLLSFVAGVAVELLEIKHDLSSLLEEPSEAMLREGSPKALILLKNSAIGLKRKGQEAKERLGKDVFLGNVRAVGALIRSDADEVLGGTRKFAWFQSRLPPVINGIDTMLSTRKVYGSMSGSNSDSGVSPLLDVSESDNAASLHCCYGWTEDWRWLVCIWTDARGELLDSLIFPFGGISSRQDTKVLQSLFIQILQQGCQIMSSSPEASNMRPRDVIITRIGGFLELEIQEWQKAIYSFGGNEVKKWPVQLRRSIPEGIPPSSNGPTLQQQDMTLIQDRNMPSSPNPLYSPHSKSSFMKGALGQSGNKKQILVEQTGMDTSRGSLHLVRSISLVAVSQDHSLHLTCQADLLTRPASGEGNQGSSGPSNYLEGFTPVKSIGSMPASHSYLLVPSPSMRYLSPATLQLPTCLTSESPPLAHLLHSRGTAIPLAMGYVVSKAVPPVRRDSAQLAKDEQPSVLSVSIIDHYGGSVATVQEKMSRGGGGNNMSKQARNFTQETTTRDCEMEMHNVLEAVAAELHSLSWLTVSPVYTERRTALPFHCDMVLRMRRLLHYADKYLSKPSEKGETTYRGD